VDTITVGLKKQCEQVRIQLFQDSIHWWVLMNRVTIPKFHKERHISCPVGWLFALHDKMYSR